MWEIDFAGILANLDESDSRRVLFVNNQNELQFRIKLISLPPENFPRDVQVVTCFAEELGYTDNYQLSNEERENNFQNYLEDYVLIFNIEEKRSSEFYYIARNIRLQKKNDEFRRDDFLIQIPVFSNSTQEVSKEGFENSIINNKFIGNNPGISSDDDDTPELIAWKDNQATEFVLYGEFESHDHAHGGFRFKYENDHIIKLNIEDSFDNYYENNNVLYFPESSYQVLKSRLEEKGTKLKTDILKVNETENNKKPVESSQEIDRESIFMDYFIHKCEDNKLYYDTKDLYNFHTSMKSGNLVILAGMSGTGKSKLVQCYADALDLKKEQLQFISVRPYWQDDADVLGYLDVVNNIYRPGDSGLINALIHAYDNPDQMHIVCFDEMNIARVEHYFSQFLSVLEMDENKKILRLYNDEAQYKIYNSTQYPSTLKIGNNILFVGTVNLDESTYQFSDKVLDRANVINLNMVSYEKVKLFNEKDANQEIKTVQINANLYNSFRKKETNISLLPQESSCLWHIHEEMQKYNKNIGIGWRIVKQISNYLNNIPPESELTREEAFDLQLVQRIVTKIRGTEEQFGKIIGIYNPDSDNVLESSLIDILDKIEGYEFNHTKLSIHDKARDLKIHGYTI